MDLDTWLGWYKILAGHTVQVEEDGGAYMWAVYSEHGKLVDWWWLRDSDIIRDINDPFTPPDFTAHN